MYTVCNRFLIENQSILVLYILRSDCTRKLILNTRCQMKHWVRALDYQAVESKSLLLINPSINQLAYLFKRLL